MTCNGIAGDSQSAAGLFKLLGDETRVDIVLERYRHWQRAPDDPYLSFSRLFEAVGGNDSGQFNYHLKRLQTALVVHHENGYMLAPRGIYLAQLVADEELAIM